MGNPYQVRRVNVSRETLEANKARPNAELAAEWGVCKTTVGVYYRAAGIKKTPQRQAAYQRYSDVRTRTHRVNVIMAAYRRARARVEAEA
jgi:hypothetical protein